MIKKFFLFSAAVFLVLNLTACMTIAVPAKTSQPLIPANEDINAPAVTPSANIANPASVNCEQQGGRVVIESRKLNGRDLGQIGICYFDDNRQCEEWALFRGECPIGGMKVTGYITVAGRYCAITGGTYAVTKEYPAVPADQEQGTCTKAGKVCDAWQYFAGQCPDQ